MIAENPDWVAFPAEDQPLVSIVIIGWRRAPYLLDCLRSIAASVREVSYEVVLVLNEPAPDLEGRIERHVRGATVLRTRANLGFGGANNLGASKARGRFLVFLNDDTTVDPNWLEALVDLIERRPSVAAVGSKILLTDGTLQEAGSVIWSDGWTFTVGRGLPGDTKRFDFERRVDYSSACSMLIRRDVFNELGGFDDTFYPAYFEDADLAMKLAQTSWQFWFQPRSVVHHRESASTNESFRQFLLDRNHEIFYQRWKDAISRHEERVAAHEPAVERAVWRAMGVPTRLLVIDDRVPDPAIGSGFGRMADVMVELAATGAYHLSLLPSIERGYERNDVLARHGIEVIDEPLDLHIAKQGLGYSLVIISRPHNYERLIEEVRSLLPGVPVVYDAEALYFRRIERQAAFCVDPVEALDLESEARVMRATEAAIAADADQIVCISHEEAEFFRTHAKGRVDINAPFLAAPSPTPAAYRERHDIGYVAGWAAGPKSPNADGLIWFVRHVLPGIRARVPGTQLIVTGANPPDNVRRLESDAVRFVGMVEDLDAFYNERLVVVVPVRYGAGVKIKTIEALQYAVPTVATSIGIEGIPVDDPLVVPGLDDPDAFAVEVAQLVSSEPYWDARRRVIFAQHNRWRSQSAESLWPGLVARLAARKPALT